MSKRGSLRQGAAQAADLTTLDSAVSSTSTTTQLDRSATTDSTQSTATGSLPEGEVSSTSLETPPAPWDLPDKNPFVGMSEEALSQIAAALSTEEGKKFLENIGDPLEAESQKSLSSSGGLEDVLSTSSSLKLVELDHNTVEATLTATETQGFDLDEEMTSKILQEGLREGDLVDFATSFSDHAYCINPERAGGARKSTRIAARHGDADTVRPAEVDKQEDVLTKTESKEEPLEQEASASPAEPSPSTPSKSCNKSPRREENVMAQLRRSSRITDKEQRMQAEKIRQENLAKEREALAAMKRDQEPGEPQTAEKKDTKKSYNMRTRAPPGVEPARRGGRGRRRGVGVGRGKQPDRTPPPPGDSPGESSSEEEDVPLTRVQKQIREDEKGTPEQTKEESQQPQPSTTPDTEPSKKGSRRPGRRAKKAGEATEGSSPDSSSKVKEEDIAAEGKAKNKGAKQGKGKKKKKEAGSETGEGTGITGKDSSREETTQEELTPKRKARKKKNSQNVTDEAAGDTDKQSKIVKLKKVISESDDRSESEAVCQGSQDETQTAAKEKPGKQKSASKKLTKKKKVITKAEQTKCESDEEEESEAVSESGDTGNETKRGKGKKGRAKKLLKKGGNILKGTKGKSGSKKDSVLAEKGEKGKTGKKKKKSKMKQEIVPLVEETVEDQSNRQDCDTRVDESKRSRGQKVEVTEIMDTDRDQLEAGDSKEETNMQNEEVRAEEKVKVQEAKMEVDLEVDSVVEDNSEDDACDDDYDDDDDDWGTDDDPDKLWCICNRPHDNRFMICCDKCEDWFHGSCVGITRKMGNKMEKNSEDWVCPHCTEKEGKHKKETDKDTESADVKESSPVEGATVPTQSDDSEKKPGAGSVEKIAEKTQEVEKTLETIQEKLKEVRQRREAKESKKSSDSSRASQTVGGVKIQGEIRKRKETMGSVNTEHEKKKKRFRVFKSPKKARLEEEPPVDEKDQCIVVGCVRQQKPDSVYCSNECIAKYTNESLLIISQEKQKIYGHKTRTEPQDPGGGAWSASERIVVMERHTGKILTGPNAPTASSLQSWLQKHPTFEVLRPGQQLGNAQSAYYSAKKDKERKEKERRQEMERRLEKAKNRLAREKERKEKEKEKEQEKEREREREKEKAMKAKREAKERKPSHERSRGQNALEFREGHRGQGHGNKGQREGGKEAGESELNAGPDPVRLDVRKALKDSLNARANQSDDILLSGMEVKRLALSIEEHLWRYYGSITDRYKRKYTSLVQNIQDTSNQGLFRKILLGHIKPYRLVRLSAKDLESKEMAKWKTKTPDTPTGSSKGSARLQEQRAGSTVQSMPKSAKGKVERPKREQPVDLLSSLIVDTTNQHGRHVFDLNCKVCTGKMPSPEHEPVAKKARLVETVSTTTPSPGKVEKPELSVKGASSVGEDSTVSTSVPKTTASATVSHVGVSEACAVTSAAGVTTVTSSDTSVVSVAAVVSSTDTGAVSSEEAAVPPVNVSSADNTASLESMGARDRMDSAKVKMTEGATGVKTQGTADRTECNDRISDTGDDKMDLDSDAPSTTEICQDDDDGVKIPVTSNRTEGDLGVKTPGTNDTSDHTCGVKTPGTGDRTDTSRAEKLPNTGERTEAPSSVPAAALQRQTGTSHSIKGKFVAGKFVPSTARHTQEKETDTETHAGILGTDRSLELKAKVIFKSGVKTEKKSESNNEPASRLHSKEETLKVKQEGSKSKDELTQTLSASKAEVSHSHVESTAATSTTVSSPDSALQSGLEVKPRYPPTSLCLWKGFICMQDMGKFVTQAYAVSGPTTNIAPEMPETIQVCGRISPEQVWDYLSKLRHSTSRDICVLRLQPSSGEEKAAYIHLYSYLNSRNRCGVVGNCAGMVKDMYIVPLASHSKVPRVLLPFDGPGIEGNRPHMLLAVVIRQKPKHLQKILTRQQREAKMQKQKDVAAAKSKQQTQESGSKPVPTKSTTTTVSTAKDEVSYTPPLEQKPPVEDPVSVTAKKQKMTRQESDQSTPEVQSSDPIIQEYAHADPKQLEMEPGPGASPYSPSSSTNEEEPYEPGDDIEMDLGSVQTATGAQKVGTASDTTQGSGQVASISTPQQNPAVVPATVPGISTVSLPQQEAATTSMPATSTKLLSGSINVGVLIEQISKSSNPAEMTAAMLATLAATNNLEDQKRVLLELTNRVEQQRQMLEQRKVNLTSGPVSSAGSGTGSQHTPAAVIETSTAVSNIPLPAADPQVPSKTKQEVTEKASTLIQSSQSSSGSEKTDPATDTSHGKNVAVGEEEAKAAKFKDKETKAETGEQTESHKKQKNVEIEAEVKGVEDSSKKVSEDKKGEVASASMKTPHESIFTNLARKRLEKKAEDAAATIGGSIRQSVLNQLSFGGNLLVLPPAIRGILTGQPSTPSTPEMGSPSQGEDMEDAEVTPSCKDRSNKDERKATTTSIEMDNKQEKTDENDSPKVSVDNENKKEDLKQDNKINVVEAAVVMTEPEKTVKEDKEKTDGIKMPEAKSTMENKEKAKCAPNEGLKVKTEEEFDELEAALNDPGGIPAGTVYPRDPHAMNALHDWDPQRKSELKQDHIKTTDPNAKKKQQEKTVAKELQTLEILKPGTKDPEKKVQEAEAVSKDKGSDPDVTVAEGVKSTAAEIQKQDKWIPVFSKDIDMRQPMQGGWTEVTKDVDWRQQAAKEAPVNIAPPPKPAWLKAFTLPGKAKASGEHAKKLSRQDQPVWMPAFLGSQLKAWNTEMKAQSSGIDREGADRVKLEHQIEVNAETKKEGKPRDSQKNEPVSEWSPVFTSQMPRTEETKLPGMDGYTPTDSGEEKYGGSSKWAPAFGINVQRPEWPRDSPGHPWKEKHTTEPEEEDSAEQPWKPIFTGMSMLGEQRQIIDSPTKHGPETARPPGPGLSTHDTRPPGEQHMSEWSPAISSCLQWSAVQPDQDVGKYGDVDHRQFPQMGQLGKFPADRDLGLPKAESTLEDKQPSTETENMYQLPASIVPSLFDIKIEPPVWLKETLRVLKEKSKEVADKEEKVDTDTNCQPITEVIQKQEIEKEVDSVEQSSITQVKKDREDGNMEEPDQEEIYQTEETEGHSSKSCTETQAGQLKPPPVPTFMLQMRMESPQMRMPFSNQGTLMPPFSVGQFPEQSPWRMPQRPGGLAGWETQKSGTENRFIQGGQGALRQPTPPPVPPLPPHLVMRAGFMAPKATEGVPRGFPPRHSFPWLGGPLIRGQRPGLMRTPRPHHAEHGEEDLERNVPGSNIGEKRELSLLGAGDAQESRPDNIRLPGDSQWSDVKRAPLLQTPKRDTDVTKTEGPARPALLQAPVSGTMDRQPLLQTPPSAPSVERPPLLQLPISLTPAPRGGGIEKPSVPPLLSEISETFGVTKGRDKKDEGPAEWRMRPGILGAPPGQEKAPTTHCVPTSGSFPVTAIQKQSVCPISQLEESPVQSSKGAGSDLADKSVSAAGNTQSSVVAPEKKLTDENLKRQQEKKSSVGSMTEQQKRIYEEHQRRLRESLQRSKASLHGGLHAQQNQASKPDPTTQQGQQRQVSQSTSGKSELSSKPACVKGQDTQSAISPKTTSAIACGSQPGTVKTQSASKNVPQVPSPSTTAPYTVTSTTGPYPSSQSGPSLQGLPDLDKTCSSKTKVVSGSAQPQNTSDKPASNLQPTNKELLSSKQVASGQQEKLSGAAGVVLKEYENAASAYDTDAPTTFGLAKLVAALKGDLPQDSSNEKGSVPDLPVSKPQQNVPKWKPALGLDSAGGEQSSQSVQHAVATSDIGCGQTVQSRVSLSKIHASSNVRKVPPGDSVEKNEEEMMADSCPLGKKVIKGNEEKHKNESHPSGTEKDIPSGDKQYGKSTASVKETNEKTQMNFSSESREKRSDKSPDVSEKSTSRSGRSRLQRSEEGNLLGRDSDQMSTESDTSATDRRTVRSRSPLQRSSSGESREARHQRQMPSPKMQDQDKRRTDPTRHRSRSPVSPSDSSRSGDRRFIERSRSSERHLSDSSRSSDKRQTEKHKEWQSPAEQHEPQSGKDPRQRLSCQQWLGLGKMPEVRSEDTQEQRTDLRVVRSSEMKHEKGGDSEDDGDLRSQSTEGRDGEETRRIVQITNRSSSAERMLGSCDSDDREFSSPAQRRHVERRDSSPSPSHDISGFASFLHGSKPASNTPKRIVEIKSQSPEVKLQDRDYRIEGLNRPRSPSFRGPDEQIQEKSPERDLGLRLGRPTPGKGLLPIPSGPHERSSRADRGRPSHFEDQDYRRGPGRPSEGTRGRSPVDHRPRRPQLDTDHCPRMPNRMHPYDAGRGRPGPRSSDAGNSRRHSEEFHRDQGRPGSRGHRGSSPPGRGHFDGGQGRHGDYDGRRQGVDHGYQRGRPHLQEQWRDSQDRYHRQGPPPRGRGGPPLRGHPHQSRPYRGRPAMDRR